MVGGTSTSWEVQKDVKDGDAPLGKPSQDGVTAPIHTICKQHPSACLCSLCSPLSMHPVDSGAMCTLIPGPSTAEDVIPQASATWLCKVALLQSTRKREGKVVPNSKRPKLTYFYHLSFKKI